jgi:hypothetical protein
MTTKLTSDDVKQICKKIMDRMKHTNFSRYWTISEMDSNQKVFESACTDHELIWTAPNHEVACFIGAILRFTIDNLDHVLYMFHLDSEDGRDETDEMQKVGEYSVKYYEDQYIEIFAELDEDDLEKFVFDNLNKNDDDVYEIVNVVTPAQIVDVIDGKDKIKISKQTSECSHELADTCEVVKGYTKKLDEKIAVENEKYDRQEKQYHTNALGFYEDEIDLCELISIEKFKQLCEKFNLVENGNDGDRKIFKNDISEIYINVYSGNRIQINSKDWDQFRGIRDRLSRNLNSMK